MGTGDYKPIREQFIAKAIDGYGVSITRTPITKTISNSRGDENLIEGTPETIKAYIVKKNTQWFLDNAGVFEQADALMLIKYTQEVNKNDQVSYLNRKYRVNEVFNRTAGEGEIIYKVCTLYLIE